MKHLPKMIVWLVVASLLLQLLFVSPKGALADVRPANIVTEFRVNTPNDTQDANPGDGICRDIQGNCSLRAAITEVNLLPTIPGNENKIFLPALQKYVLDGQLQIEKSLTLIGNTSCPNTACTIIDGNARSRIFNIKGANYPKVIIEGVIIQNGWVISSNPGTFDPIDNGGGIRIESGSDVTLSNVIVRYNGTESRRGGGIANSGALHIRRSKVCSNNNADRYSRPAIPDLQDPAFPCQSWELFTTSIGGVSQLGGGIANFKDAVLYIDQSLISFNNSNLAGGIYNGGTLEMVDSTVSNNVGRDIGGGVYNTGTARILRSTFNANRGNRRLGGGIYNSGSAGLYIDQSLISLNNSNQGGGIYNGGVLEMVDSRVRDNVGRDSGGGVYNTGTARILRSTFNANRGDQHSGGGIYNFGSFGSVTLINSTISGNIGNNQPGDIGGGGIKNEGRMSIGSSTITRNYSDNVSDLSGHGIHNRGTVLMANTILADNFQDDILDSSLISECFSKSTFFVTANFVSLGFNLVGLLGRDCNFVYSSASGDRVGAANNRIDPMLGPLTPVSGTWIAIHALDPDSPARDHGAAPVPEPGFWDCQRIDQRGTTRPQGTGCDIGAYELDVVGTITNTPKPPTDTPTPGPTSTPKPPTETPTPGPTSTPKPPTNTPTFTPTAQPP